MVASLGALLLVASCSTLPPGPQMARSPLQPGDLTVEAVSGEAGGSPISTPAPADEAGTLTSEPTATVVTGRTGGDTAGPPTHTLTICMGTEPVSLMPYLDGSEAARMVQALLYAAPVDIVGYATRPGILDEVPSLEDGSAVVTLLRVLPGDRVLNDAGEVVTLTQGTRIRPAGCRTSTCAVTFDVSDVEMDQMRVVFRLHTGLAWEDGSPVQAADSLYSLELARALASPELQGVAPGEALELRTESYLALDSQTVVWTGVPGYLPQSYQTLFWLPMPSAAWRATALADLFLRENVVHTPMGYGSYGHVEWDGSSAIRLYRSETYAAATGVRPFFDAVAFRFVDPGDPAGALDALAGGTCDILTSDIDLEAVFPEMLALQSAGSLRILAQPGVSWEHLTFNANVSPSRPPLFADVRTRQAVAHCVDREQLVSELTHGMGTLMETYVPPDAPLYASDVQGYTHDVALGSAMLDEAGWRDEDGDGVREAHGVEGVSEGLPFRLTYVTTGSDRRLRTAQLIAAELSVCGISVDTQVYEPWELFAQNPENVLVGGNFDLAQVALSADLLPQCSTYASWAVPALTNGWSGLNVGRFSSPGYDEACAVASTALPGEVEFVDAHHEAQRIFAEELPALPLYRTVSFLAARPDLTGVTPDALSVVTWNVERMR